MWTRAELKSRAKAVLKNSYWESVVAIMAYSAISIGIAFVATVVPFGTILAIIFLILPMRVGLNYFFMQNQVAPSMMKNVFYSFDGRKYMKIVSSMGWMYLFTLLWSMISMAGFFILLIKGFSLYIPYLMNDRYLTNFPALVSSWIPALIVSGVIYLAGLIIAIIKGLSYSMTAYILTDNPLIGYERALKLSMAMTDGQKWEMFLLGLSFIWWSLLALLTCGLGFLFLSPYIASTNAELYVKLRDNAINNGLTSPQELNVYPK